MMSGLSSEFIQDKIRYAVLRPFPHDLATHTVTVQALKEALEAVVRGEGLGRAEAMTLRELNEPRLKERLESLKVLGWKTERASRKDSRGKKIPGYEETKGEIINFPLVCMLSGKVHELKFEAHACRLHLTRDQTEKWIEGMKATSERTGGRRDPRYQNPVAETMHVILSFGKFWWTSNSTNWEVMDHGGMMIHCEAFGWEKLETEKRNVE